MINSLKGVMSLHNVANVGIKLYNKLPNKIKNYKSYRSLKES
jgi:hypothetical protein